MATIALHVIGNNFSQLPVFSTSWLTFGTRGLTEGDSLMDQIKLN
jgi:hypothetical protein